MAVKCFVFLSVFCLWICANEAKSSLPDGVDEEAYCVACETMAKVLFERLSGPDLENRSDRTDAILKTMCSQGHFTSVIEYQPSIMVSACKHLLKGHKTQLSRGIEKTLSSTGSLLELKQAMCHLSSPACRTVRQSPNLNTKINTVTDEETLDGIEAYIKAHNADVKIAGHRKDEL